MQGHRERPESCRAPRGHDRVTKILGETTLSRPCGLIHETMPWRLWAELRRWWLQCVALARSQIPEGCVVLLPVAALVDLRRAASGTLFAIRRCQPSRGVLLGPDRVPLTRFSDSCAARHPVLALGGACNGWDCD